MKIFQVISSLGNGGAEKLVVELSNELANTDDVTIISIKKVEEWMYLPNNLSGNVNLLELGKKKGFDLKIISSLFHLLRKHKPDVVHIHLNMPLYYFLPLIPLFNNIKFVFTIHSTFELHKKFISRLNKLLYYRKVSNICLSQNIYTNFNEAFLRLSFYQIENGIKRLKSSQDAEEIRTEVQKIKEMYDFVFLFVGRLSYEKNIPLLLEVFLSNTLIDVKLLIIGDGDEKTKINIQDVSKKTSNRIQFLGPKLNVIDYMRNVDALVLTSRYEGLPIVLLEALYTGLPVISTPVGAIPDIIRNHLNGFLSDGISKEEVLKAVNLFRGLDKKRIDIIKRNNKKLFEEKFSIEMCARKHEHLYGNLLKN